MNLKPILSPYRPHPEAGLLVHLPLTRRAGKSAAGILLLASLIGNALAQSADWQSVIWREPQVRYLLADMTLGGNVAMYRDYAMREKDPDSREAVRLWDARARVVNTNAFERRWVTNRFGKDGRVMRVVFRGTTRTISGNEVLLSSDAVLNEGRIRYILLNLSLGNPGLVDWSGRVELEAAEAMRRWKEGARVVSTNWFMILTEPSPKGSIEIVFRHNERRQSWINGDQIYLNSDLPYPETNVRYFMADIALGGSLEFYRAAAERDHEMGCLEAVRRTEEGFKITNLDQFERKKVEGKTLITRKGRLERICGMEIQLSSD